MKFDFNAIGESVFEALSRYSQQTAESQPSSRKKAKASTCTPCAARAQLEAAKARYMGKK